MNLGDTVRPKIDPIRTIGFVFLWPTCNSYRPEDNRGPGKLFDDELGFVVEVQPSRYTSQIIRVLSSTGNIGWVSADKLEVL